MPIAQNEIFGPVVCVMPYENDQQAIDMANDNDYGLSGYVSGADSDRVNRIAYELRAGMVHLNGAQMDRTAPFGGYKHSGNGRERGPQGFEEFSRNQSFVGCSMNRFLLSMLRFPNKKGPFDWLIFYIGVFWW